MSEKAFHFVNTDLDFRRKVDGCYINFVTMLDKYKKHVNEKNQEK